ncbi:TAT leader-containing periplasmic protein [Shewanella algae]|uniref:TAT leader-containing periplasmic protein n=1 Tax=Shewanella algae TaxID=38313 RepID=UPI00255634B8|nr:TAT leader-containing periplasmic protein [Shewanella algae]MDL2196967.1 TAT leader-containing periplasmic protein [Shewanella algae]
MQRRQFLLWALGGTSALALGVSLYEEEEIANLSEHEKPHDLLLGALIPVLLEEALPEINKHRTSAINRTLDAVNQTLKWLPKAQRQELEQLLDILENRFGLLLLSGSMTPLMLRSPNELVEMLESWRSSWMALLQQAYLGLRELLMASYYACPEHWDRLNYNKPKLAF